MVISGLVGLEIKEDGRISVDPLIPIGSWNWFCLDGIEYQGKTITIVYDKNGSKYNLPFGLTILVDGERVAHSKKLKPLEFKL